MLHVFGQSAGQGWQQLAELGAALVLSALIGLEREFRQKSAGLRTHSLVGFGAVLFMLVSKYGFFDVLHPGRIVLDPSRVAAQIVSGIGFIGAGIIFVRRDSVQGLTTAASIWVTAAVGAACGAGLTMLGAAATVGYFFIALCLRQVTHRLNGSSLTTSVVTVRYFDGRGTLRQVLARTCDVGFVIGEVLTRAVGTDGVGKHGNGSHSQLLAKAPSQVVEVSLQLRGKGSITELATLLSGLDGVVSINAGTTDETADDT
jgi:putative Mg2+ transporter-C (MgtC) family protein